MINTLLEHVPIKMEVKDIDEEATDNAANEATGLEMANDDEEIDETDEELDDDDDEEDEEDEEEEDEEESETETDALEIEQEATMLISSDEEAELEAQRIRFPDKMAVKKLRRDSLKSSRSSSRNSQNSNSSSTKSSKPQNTAEVVALKDTREETDKKQRISPRLKLMEKNTSVESLQKENNNNTNTQTKKKTEHKKLENNKNKQQETSKCLDNNKSTESNNKNLENNRNIENLRKSPANVPSQASKSRRGSNNSTCSVASTVASDSAETESCGNIYVFNLQQKLIFNCEFCDLKYGDLENFGRHLHEAHKLFSFDEDPEKENAPRNLRKSNRMSNSNNAPKNAANVKKEPLQCLDALAEPPPVVALPLSVLAEPLESCGNVFMLNHRKLFLVCGYCECKYANLDLFEKHLRQQHRIFEGCRNEVNVVPKVEIKQEMFVITEVLGQQDHIAPQAMVSIPAEIPLDISISPENEAATIAALNETMEMEEDVLEEQPTSSSCAKADNGLVSTLLKEPLAKDAITNEHSKPKDSENLLEAMEVEKPVAVKKPRNKRRSSPVKPLASPNKRPKRNTRNKTKVQEETTPTIVEPNVAEQIAPTETTQLMETENINVTIKSADTKPNISKESTEESTEKSSDTIEPQTTTTPDKAAETEKVIVQETTETKEIKKPTKTKKTTSTETTATRKSISTESIENKKPTKSAESKQITPLETIDTINTTKTAEFKKATSPEVVTETKKPIKSAEPKKSNPKQTTETKEIKTPTKAEESKKPTTIETIEIQETKNLRKTAESKKVTPIETTEIKKSTKPTASMKVTSTKTTETTETTKATKTVGSKKPTAAPETKEARKSVEINESTPAVIPETKESAISIKSAETKEPTIAVVSSETKVNRVTIKAQEYNKPIAQETEATKETRKTTKTQELTTPEIKENRKSTKLEANEPTIIPEETAEAITETETNSLTTQELLETQTPTKAEARKPKQTKKGRKSTTKAPRKSTETKKPTKLETPDSEIEPESSETEMQCNECDKKFARRESLKIHKRVHTGEKPFVCDICQKTFRAKQNLTMHKKFHMGDASKTFECEHCDKKFMRNTDLKVHMRTHTGEKKFKCGICLQGYASKVNVQTHIERDHLSADGVVGTPPRGKKKSGPNFKVLREELEYQKKIIEELQKAKKEKEIITPTLQPTTPPPPPSPVEQLTAETLQHYAEEDSDMQDLNADPVNDIIEQIQNEILLSEQERQQENVQANSVTFTINTVPDSNEALKLHNNANTSTNSIVLESQANELLNSPVDIKPTLLQVVKRYVCDQCNRTFKKHIRLVEHLRVHTGEKPFGCDECGKQFRIRMRLNEHKLRHSKDKKFKCEICGLGCCTKQDLNLHMRHHTNDRRFQCSMCPKAFVRSSDLKTHVRVHTGEKPYVCDICHKCFRANPNLIVHKKSHMGEASKTFQCEHCDKKFMRNIDRKVHMRSHTGEKPYKCEICQRGYSSKFNVRAHIERDHISANGMGTPPKGKKKPGPKPKSLKAELEKQKKLIEELQHQLLQQIKTDEKIIPSEEEILPHDTLQDCTITASSPLVSSSSNDPIQNAYDLLKKLKSATTTSKPLTIIPSPPPMAEPASNPFTKAKKACSTLLPLTITQKIEQHSPVPSTSSSTSLSCLTTPSPPKTTATKVVSQKTSLGIQQVSVTVSMQVENVTAASSPTTPEKENAGILTTSSSGGATTTMTSVKKERKITSYFTVVGQKADA
ncbi:uncharacterized protein Phs [Calliphora vicina]|uniref:uncharacterized protein Phs n=1 Tax=Calliphora vicina TaxID=7373 RepID=UPI00325B0DA5